MDIIDERWVETDGELQTTIKANDFMSAVDLVLRIAEVAEEQNHHPNISIHDYKQLTITLRSHDTGEIGERDYKLASAIDELLAE